MDKPIYHLENLLRDRKEDVADFVGPLDLILHLLSKNKIEIRDISVTQILDQYMEWMSKRQEMDLEVASDFIAMAAHLLYIKTRMILSAQDEEALTETEQLVVSLEERQRHENYQRVKRVLPVMERLYSEGSAYLGKAPSVFLPERQRQYDHGAEDIIQAVARILERQRKKKPPGKAEFHGIIRKEPYPLEKKTNEIFQSLRISEKQTLRSLWKKSESRSEVVAVFLVTLELLKTGEILLSSEGGEIYLSIA